MDDGEDDSSYLPQEHGVNNSTQKDPTRNSMFSSANSDQEEDLGDEESGEDTDDEVTDDDDDDEEDEDEDNDDSTQPRKKRKLKNLISNYEFVPRVPPSAPPTALPRPSSRRTRQLGLDWTERETFVLLDACGERFLQHGRKSLRSEEWQEVAEKISQETQIMRTDTQCRNRLGTLKKKYKKEKMRFDGVTSKWPFYRKMDMILDNSPTQDQQASLSCGVDSGEYVFTNPKVRDEMWDSPGNGKRNRVNESSSCSFRLLANSFEKFSEIYEKIEVNKRKQMVEIENMRMDFHREIETQRRKLLERAQAEIAKIRQPENDDDKGNDLSTDE